jgi:hypothetical protein
MHQPPRTGDDDDQRIFQQMLGYCDGAAFVRRAKRVEDAERILAEQLGARRSENLSMVRLRIGQLRALAGTWDALLPLLAEDESLAVLSALHAELQPVLRVAVEPTSSHHVLRAALAELIYAMELFNERWHRFLMQFDLSPINALRDGYNRHYLIEKECALRNTRVARLGFRRLDPLTTADLLKRFPPLTVPQLAV